MEEEGFEARVVAYVVRLTLISCAYSAHELCGIELSVHCYFGLLAVLLSSVKNSGTTCQNNK